jgi:pimeloyl-ACP methyl ester carboxylesterase
MGPDALEEGESNDESGEETDSRVEETNKPDPAPQVSSMPACANSAEASLLDFVKVEASVDSYFETDSSKPETAEVYCLLGDTHDKLPVVMLPGLGLSHYMFLGTPDGRAGFVSYFVDAGHPVYVMNPSANAASALDTEPGMGLQRWGTERFWDRWGLGPSDGVAYEDVRFPVESISEFVDHMPLWGGGNDAEEELLQLLEAVGPAILVFHSAGGEAAFSVALNHPSVVSHMVALEPVGCPSEGEDFAEVPFLAVYGDYVQPRGQGSRLRACTATAAMVAEVGLKGEVLSYPEKQVFGNTHLFTQDDNNAQIAGDIIAWIE